jgi:hypothetical protein
MRHFVHHCPFVPSKVMIFFDVPGVPRIQLPAEATPVRIAGEISYVFENVATFKVASPTACYNAKAHETHYRRVPGHEPIAEIIVSNKKGTAASIQLTGAIGHEFEARGYSRNAEWQRFRFTEGGIVKV